MDDSCLNLSERLRQKIGRETRERSIAIRFTKTEADQISAAARAKDSTVREWSREVLLREARRSENDILLTELTGMRLLLVNLLCPMLTGKTVSEEWISNTMEAVRQQKRRATKDLLQLYAEGGK